LCAIIKDNIPRFFQIKRLPERERQRERGERGKREESDERASLLWSIRNNRNNLRKDVEGLRSREKGSLIENSQRARYSLLHTAA